MLTQADNLLTFAEIAIAFAGFAALAGVIGKSRSREAARIDLERLRAVIYSSLLVVVAAMIPVVIAQYHVLEGDIWRISSLITLVLNWVVLVVVTRHARQGIVGDARDKIATWVVIPMEAAAELPLIANVLALLSAYAPAFYFTFLLVGLCQTAFMFLRLVDSLFAHEGGE